MATVTSTTVEVTIGDYTYRAEVDGNRVELFRDGVSAGSATWGGKRIEDFPIVLSNDAEDELDAAIRENLAKAWRSGPTVAEVSPPSVHATPVADEGRTPGSKPALQKRR